MIEISTGTEMKAVFFDLDGTLVNTSEDIVNSINHTRLNFSLCEFSLEEGVEKIGLGFETLLKRSLDEITPDEDILKEARKIFIDYYLQHITDYSHPYSGIEDVLSFLKDLNIIQCIITNKHISSSEKLLEELNLRSYFKVVKGGGCGLELKPAPDMIEDAGKNIGYPPDDIIMIGDSWTDISSAEQAGCLSILVNWGFKDIRGYKPDYSVENPEHLKELLADIIFKY